MSRRTEFLAPHRSFDAPRAVGESGRMDRHARVLSGSPASELPLINIRAPAYTGPQMRRTEWDALDRCPICGIPRSDADLDIYGGWCVDRDGCSRRWLDRQRNSP